MSKMMKVTRTLLVVLITAGTLSGQAQGTSSGWKAGVARTIITPEQSMWMAGYAFRDHAAEGTLHDLWAKALALEDAQKNRAVLVTTDLLGFPKAMSDRIRDQVSKKYKLSKAQIILNSSHTHAGPVLTDALKDIYPLGEADLKKIEQYSVLLEKKIVDLVGKALQSMGPATLHSQNGVTRFQVNRRNNNATTLAQQSDLNGPNDYAVPVIKVANASGKLLAVAFGYACHNTTLSNYHWSGDYAGFAQIELEKAHPGTTALFFQGAGADQNPLPRGTVPMAEQYGRTLAAAVDRVLQEEMRPLEATLKTGYREVELPLSPVPSATQLAEMAEKLEGYQKRWAERLRDEVKQGAKLPTSYPYPVQVWKLGDQGIAILGGELVVGYAIALKKALGHDLFVMGYSNDVMSYIPTVTILEEGGYEGHTSQMVYGLPSKWTADIENVIVGETVRLAEEVGVRKTE